jgi:hypothetical protein
MSASESTPKSLDVAARPDVDVVRLYWDGEAKKQEEHSSLETSKEGELRAGSSGLVTESGHVVGTCPRLAYLRLKQVQWEKRERSDYLMMENGVWNEDIWADVLRRSWPGTIRRESEVPVRFQLASGRWVSGRPDLVLCQDDGTPIKGLELKNASSVWTGRDVASERTPKTDHLIQACIYMWQLGVPFDLCYASRVKYAVPTKSWLEKMFPAQGAPGSELLEYNDNGGTKALKPFLSIFPLRLTKGRVEYWSDGDWRDTPVHLAGILHYFEGVDSMESRNELPQRPVVMKLNGKLGYDPCDPAYCGLSAVCQKAEGRDLRWWEDAVRAYAQTVDVMSTFKG